MGGQEIYSGQSSYPTLTYCDIEGGWQGEGNIDLNPLFRDPAEGDFHLMSVVCGDSADSPCIDAGHPDSIDIILGCQFGLGGARADMGAYGGDNGDWVTGIGGQDNSESYPLPEGISMLRSYPNPFNATTRIEFVIDTESQISLNIYNILGQKIAKLYDGKIAAGIQSIIWDAGDFPSGIYFARIVSDNYSDGIKISLLK